MSCQDDDSRGESSQEPRSRLLLAMSGFCMCSVGLPWNGCRGAVGSVTGNVFPEDTTEGTRRVGRVRECPSANPMHKKPKKRECAQTEWLLGVARRWKGPERKLGAVGIGKKMEQCHEELATEKGTVNK